MGADPCPSVRRSGPFRRRCGINANDEAAEPNSGGKKMYGIGNNVHDASPSLPQSGRDRPANDAKRIAARSGIIQF